jgi:hypothetical protein
LRREFNPRTDDAILRLARQAEELTGLMRLQVAALLEEAVDVSAARVVIYAARLRREPEPLVREVLRGAWREAGWPEQPMSDAAWRKLSQLLHEESTRTDLPGGIEVEVSRGTVRLSRPRT